MMSLQEFLTRFIDGDMSLITCEYNGLCYHISVHCDEQGYDLVREKFISTFESWPKTTGCSSYPIKYNYKGYCLLYKGKQLKLRKELCQHALNKLYNGEKYEYNKQKQNFIIRCIKRCFTKNKG